MERGSDVVSVEVLGHTLGPTPAAIEIVVPFIVLVQRPAAVMAPLRAGLIKRDGESGAEGAQTLVTNRPDLAI